MDIEEINFAFAMLEGLYGKQAKLNQFIEVLGAEENIEFLEAEIVLAEKFLVKALGGQEANWQNIAGKEYFFDFGYRKALTREQLVNQIKMDIENDYEDDF